MYNFGTPEQEAQLLLDSISASEHTGPMCPTVSWDDMSLKQKETYFVYLRSALESSAREPIISEEAIEYLLAEYEKVFEYLANTPSKLSKALKNKTHAFFMSDNPTLVRHFKSLVRNN